MAGAGSVGHTQCHVWRKGMLEAQAPVFVIRRFRAQVGIAVGYGLRAGGIRGDEACAVARVDEWRRLVGGIPVVPIEGRLARDRAGKRGGGVEAQLAEPLAAIHTSAISACVNVVYGEASAYDGLFAD